MINPTMHVEAHACVASYPALQWYNTQFSLPMILKILPKRNVFWPWKRAENENVQFLAIEICLPMKILYFAHEKMFW